MKKIVGWIAGTALALVTVHTALVLFTNSLDLSVYAQAPAPAALQIANPHYVSIPMEITVNKPVADVWKRVGKYCDIGEWLRVSCTIISGKDGEIGAVRSVANEVLVGRRDVMRLPQNTDLLQERINDFSHRFLEAIAQDEIVQDLLEQLLLHIDHGHHQLIDVHHHVVVQLAKLQHLPVHVVQRHVGNFGDLDAVVVEQRNVDDLFQPISDFPDFPPFAVVGAIPRQNSGQWFVSDTW